MLSAHDPMRGVLTGAFFGAFGSTLMALGLSFSLVLPIVVGLALLVGRMGRRVSHFR